MRAVTKPTSRELRRLVPGRLVQVAGSAHHVVVDEGPDDVPPVLFTSGLGGAWYDWDAVVPLLGYADMRPFLTAGFLPAPHTMHANLTLWRDPDTARPAQSFYLDVI